MKIGILACLYGNPEYLEPCLENWIKLKEKHNIIISVVHGQFKENHENRIPDNDKETLNKLLNNNYYKYLYIQNNHWYKSEKDYIYQTEFELRNHALQPLLKEKCDIIWLLDLDEFYTEEQIENIINYIKQPESQNFCWFSIPMKNYILDGKQWVDGFCPPRIFRRSVGDMVNLEIDRFYYDNDIIYKTTNDWPNETNYKILANKKIPKETCYVKHLTWLHSNGKDKVNYQLKHFGHCSYKWNENTQKIEIDPDFYIKNRLEMPIIYQDE